MISDSGEQLQSSLRTSDSSSPRSKPNAQGSPRVRQRAPHCSQGIRNASAPGGTVAAHMDVCMGYYIYMIIHVAVPNKDRKVR